MSQVIKNISILSFAREAITYILNGNEKYIKWGTDNKFPEKVIELYDTVPAHESAINFIETNLTAAGIEQLNIWQLKKIVLDYLMFGGFTTIIQKLRNGNFDTKHLDISKCRLNPDKTKIGYSEDWKVARNTIVWYDVVNSINEVKTEGVFYFKNNKSREAYPRPAYLSAFKSIETSSTIATYHNNNARNGFTPNTVINFNNGVPDEDTQRNIEKQIKEKFTGPEAQKFILSFNDTVDNAVTISKLGDDNLDTKFETLQKFVQNEIIVAHQITSGQLIGVRPESTGFSQQEYEESLKVFKETVIAGYRNELEYALSTLFGTDIKIKENEQNTADIATNA